MTCVRDLDRVTEPQPGVAIEARGDRGQIAFVLRPTVLRLEQQDDLGRDVRHAILRHTTQRIQRTGDGGFAPEDPPVLAGLREQHLELPCLRTRTPAPDLVYREPELLALVPRSQRSRALRVHGQIPPREMVL